MDKQEIKKLIEKGESQKVEFKEKFDKETIETGARAAIAGGFTTVCAMPNKEPPCDTQAQARFIIEKAEKAKLANVLPVGAITKKREGEELSEMAELKEAGCPAFSDDGEGGSGRRNPVFEPARAVSRIIRGLQQGRQFPLRSVVSSRYWRLGGRRSSPMSQGIPGRSQQADELTQGGHAFRSCRTQQA